MSRDDWRSTSSGTSDLILVGGETNNRIMHDVWWFSATTGRWSEILNCDAPSSPPRPSLFITARLASIRCCIVAVPGSRLLHFVSNREVVVVDLDAKKIVLGTNKGHEHRKDDDAGTATSSVSQQLRKPHHRPFQLIVPIPWYFSLEYEYINVLLSQEQFCSSTVSNHASNRMTGEEEALEQKGSSSVRRRSIGNHIAASGSVISGVEVMSSASRYDNSVVDNVEEVWAKRPRREQEEGGPPSVAVKDEVNHNVSEASEVVIGGRHHNNKVAPLLRDHSRVRVLEASKPAAWHRSMVGRFR